MAWTSHGPVGGGGLLLGLTTAMTYGALNDPAFRGKTLTFAGLRLENLESPYGDAIRVKTMGDTNQRLLHTLGVTLKTLPDTAIESGLQYLEGYVVGLPVEGAAGMAASPVAAPRHRQGRLWVSILSGGNVLPE